MGRSAEFLVLGARVRSGAVVIEVPQAAIDLAKQFEGFHRVPKFDQGRAHPYICPAGFWTIGYGHLCDPTHPPITVDEAEVYLARDLQTALVATLRYCPALVTEPEERLAAIVDFTFNLGAGRLQTSTLRRRLNKRDWVSAAYELKRWIRGGGKPLPGLMLRRKSEVDLLLHCEALERSKGLLQAG
jgi:lysozyme